MAKRFISYLNKHEVVEMKEKGKATFKSYISEIKDGDEEDEETKGDDEDEEVEKNATAFFENLMQPNLLPGEQIISHAESVLKYAPYSDRKQGMSGNLFVTNFKVCFVTADKSSYTYKETKSRQRNKLIDDNDTPLTCIDSIIQVFSGGKKKTLQPGSVVSPSTKYLEIHCKDFQLHVFGFKFVPKDQAKRIVQAILHHSCPNRSDLLFAYEFGLNGKFTENTLRNKFYEQSHWDAELLRLQCNGKWRVTDVNREFHMSLNLPEYFVIPTFLTDSELTRMANQYVGERLPTWSYTCANGASLIRMSVLLPDSDFKTCEEKMVLAVKEASGNRDLKIVDLTETCPSVADIRTSSIKLRALCMTDTYSEFFRQDATWLSQLDGSQWLINVGRCLKTAAEVADLLISKVSVALKEERAVDLSCVVSCLAQLIIDPYFRTQEGFSFLVQREWTVMGHPFQRRNHLIQGTPENDKGPVFLLFLDSVWQLLQQFPSRFAFSETFLTTLWDTAHLGIFDTFLFDSAWERRRFFREGRKLANICLPSAWEWSLQFSEDDVLLFNNPLFVLHTSSDLEGVISIARGSLKRQQKTTTFSYAHMLTDFYDLEKKKSDLFRKPDSDVLAPINSAPAMLWIWSQCYLRWCVPAQILRGGRPAEYMHQCLLVEEILCLQHRIKKLEEQKDRRKKSVGSLKLPRPQSGLVFSLESKSVLDSGYLTSSFPFPAAVTTQTQHKLIDGPLSMFLHESLVQYNYDEDMAED
ncbi:myotubularin-related protein 10-B-like isoform X3 [Pomacea canaliculata]|uniref:myotubularin-related protein 10-B-like isoform X3 n=1 Tax=Pomacea canaliculata TaxID=400727 RepID=UPI000D739E68|nr:myotubularin-related protein 10-B-like isoform X3 [Pomacea canaliculata]